MPAKKKDSVSLEDLNPFELEASPEDIDLLKKGLAALDHKRAIWIGVLGALERQARLPSSIDAPARPAVHDVIHKAARSTRQGEAPTEPLVVHEGSLTDVVYKILVRAARPISYGDLREELVKTDIGRDLRPDEKPYYAVIQRLRQKGHCVYYKGRMCTPENLKQFQADVAAGIVRDVDEGPRLTSRWGDAMVAFLKTRGGWVKSREIIEHLSTLPGFKDRKFVESQAYATLKGMRYRQKIVERRGRSAKAEWRYIGDRDANAEAQAAEAAAEATRLPLLRH